MFCTLLILKQIYQEQRKQGNRNYAKDHSFEEWKRWYLKGN